MSASPKTETKIRPFPIWLGVSSLVVSILVLRYGGNSDFSSPRGFHFFWTAFFSLYGIALILSAFSMAGLVRRWSIGFLIVYSVAGFAGCQSTVQRSSASVHVNTSRGSYNRRPPGGKMADDRVNSSTLWFRALAFLCWGSGVALYFRPDSGFGFLASKPKILAQRLPSPPMQSILKDRFFDHDPRYPGCSPPDRDSSMALTAVAAHLRFNGFSDVTRTVRGETSYSCRAPNGRRFSFSAPPDIAPQLTACESGHKLHFYIKALRQPWNTIALTPDESTSLQSSATDAAVYVGLVSISPVLSNNPICMAGFGLDFRGFFPLHHSQSEETGPSKDLVLSAGAALSAMLYTTPTRPPV